MPTPTWNRVLDIYLNVESLRAETTLFRGRSNTDFLDQMGAVVGDRILTRLHFTRRATAAGQPLEIQELPENNGIVLAGKARDNLGAAGLLFSTTDFTEDSDDDGPWYESILDLNTQPLIDAIDVAGETLLCLVDIEVQNPDNTKRFTLQCLWRIRQQVFSGDEPEPQDGQPPYPPAGMLVVKYRGTLAIGDGAATVTASGLGLEFTPAQVLVTLRKPDAAAPGIAVTGVLDDSISTDGFTVALQGETPSTGYKLDYLLIE